MLKDVKGDLRHLRQRDFASGSCPQNCISSIELNKGISLCPVSWLVTTQLLQMISDSQLVRGIIPMLFFQVDEPISLTSIHKYWYVHTQIGRYTFLRIIRMFICTYTHTHTYVRTCLPTGIYACVGMCFCAFIFHPDKDSFCRCSREEDGEWS